MDQLPDVILFEIFSNLDFLDLCMCSQVCRRWHAITQSASLKKKIIIKKHLKYWQLPLLVQYHFHERLEIFEFWGDADSPLVPVIKETFFKLRAKCPQLKKLVLVACAMTYVTLEDMPASLRHLSVRRSEINPYQLFGARPELCVPHLTCLDVGGVSNFLTSADLHIFTMLKSLRCLYLEGCFRINNGGIESITDILRHLEVLDVEGTDISNQGVQTIITHGSALIELYVGHININDDAFEFVPVDKLLKLRTLCVVNTRISRLTVRKLSNFNVGNVNILSDFDPEYINMENRSGVCEACVCNLDNLWDDSPIEQFDPCNHYLSHSCCC